ncbi:MAG: outer membrane beta-barrel protein [Alistipes sp.]|nr:outer membrane beta-barrel protein [Alistipes sp.]
MDKFNSIAKFIVSGFLLLTIPFKSLSGPVFSGELQDGSPGIYGVVLDAVTLEPIIGASVVIDGTYHGTATDVEGRFSFTNLQPGPYRLYIRMLTYKEFYSDEIVLREGQRVELEAGLTEEVSTLDNIVVVAHMPIGTDAGLLNRMRASNVVASGVSAQQITRTQDKDASEVVRRIPGISIIDDKFVIVRGLNQRYNNTWINGSPAPSSDADSRAFSFDIIPSSQIENIMVVKTPAAEYPADYSGGFVMVRTKIAADRNNYQISYGTGINDKTHFKDFHYLKGSSTDFLGFDNGLRDLKGVPGFVENTDMETIDRITKNGFNNDWRLRSRKPLPDQKLNMAMNQSYPLRNGDKVNMALALNYSLTSKTILDMENSLYGVYDANNDRPNLNFSYKDNQYTTDARLGAMANFAYTRRGRNGYSSHTYEFRNMVNQLGRDRYTIREGWRNVSGYYDEQHEEFLYQSRLSYNGQFAGEHIFGTTADDRLDWTVGYAYSNRYQPDRRLIKRTKDESNEVYEYEIGRSDVQRVYTWLDENAVSGAVNYRRNFGIGSLENINLRTGLFADYKSRDYRTRDFVYVWDNSGSLLEKGFTELPLQDLFSGPLLGTDGIYIRDNTDNTNNYKGDHAIYAAYAAVNIPIHRFNIYAGLRFERSDMRITSYLQPGSDKSSKKKYIYNDLFPSFNASYDTSEKSLLRLAYGMTVNRQEFRELSGSTYFDFEMFSFISGSPDLKPATVQNVDVRYEYYPSSGEVVSVAMFFKHFRNPIEWSFVNAGGEYQYYFTNALSARTYGVEVDLRKNLGFMGMRDFTFTMNAAVMKSNVHFEDDSHDHDRPMQGQSPYLINGGLFYQQRHGLFSAGVLYNRIGKRIVGLGRVESADGDSFNNNIPDMYEMPRDVIDLTFGVKLSGVFDLKGAARDILARKVRYMQQPRFMDNTGKIHTRKQYPRSYKPGRSFSLTLTATF